LYCFGLTSALVEEQKTGYLSVQFPLTSPRHKYSILVVSRYSYYSIRVTTITTIVNAQAEKS